MARTATPWRAGPLGTTAINVQARRGSWSSSSNALVIRISGAVYVDPNAATGKPAITGTPQVGQTLTAGMGNIADADDLPSTTFPLGYSFQWVRVDSANNETNVGTNRTYSPTSSDEGSTIKVEVSFTDGAGNAEGPLPSDATAAVVAAAGPCPAGYDWCTTMTVGVGLSAGFTTTGFSADSSLGLLDDTTIDYGTPNGVQAITTLVGPGTSSVVVFLDAFVPRGSVFNFGGTEFTADASSILSTVGQYNWNIPANFAWIDGQKVRVSANLAPALESARVNGTTLVLTHSEDLDTGSTPAASAYTVKVNGGAGPAVSRVSVGIRTVTLTLATAVTAADNDVTVDYDAPASSPLQDVSGLDAPDFTIAVTNNTGATNNPATGTPAITGTPQVDQTLTAGLGTIADTNHLPTTTFPDGYSFQWVRVDSANNETNVGTDSSTYSATSSDEGSTIRVDVSFTDGGGTEETVPSDAVGPVVPAAGPCPAGYDWCTTMTVGVGLRGGFTTTGFSADTSVGSLDDTTIDYGTPNGVQAITTLVGPGTSSVAVFLDAFVPRGSVFNFGGTEFTADAGSDEALWVGITGTSPRTSAGSTARK